MYNLLTWEILEGPIVAIDCEEQASEIAVRFIGGALRGAVADRCGRAGILGELTDLHCGLI